MGLPGGSFERVREGVGSCFGMSARGVPPLAGAPGLMAGYRWLARRASLHHRQRLCARGGRGESEKRRVECERGEGVGGWPLLGSRCEFGWGSRAHAAGERLVEAGSGKSARMDTPGIGSPPLKRWSTSEQAR